MINSVSYDNNHPAFYANLNSKKLRFKQNDFFVRIRGYGKNRDWAKEVIQTADTAVNMARNSTSCENVLKFITAGISKANKFTRDIAKACHSGILRTSREGWRYGSDWDGYDIGTNYSNTARYKSYMERLDETAKNPLTNPYKDIGLTIPVITESEHYLKHANKKYINNALQRVISLYGSITKYNTRDMNFARLDKVNNHIAEIRWIMAHATPWKRGSDAISNVFMRVIYKSLGIKSYPLKKDISLDMEAYCTELSDYKKRFPTFFEKPPEIVK